MIQGQLTNSLHFTRKEPNFDNLSATSGERNNIGYDQDCRPVLFDVPFSGMNTQAAFHVRFCTMRPDKITSARRVGKYHVACLDNEAFIITPYFDDAHHERDMCSTTG